MMRASEHARSSGLRGSTSQHNRCRKGRKGPRVARVARVATKARFQKSATSSSLPLDNSRSNANVVRLSWRYRGSELTMSR